MINKNIQIIALHFFSILFWCHKISLLNWKIHCKICCKFLSTYYNHCVAKFEWTAALLVLLKRNAILSAMQSAITAWLRRGHWLLLRRAVACCCCTGCAADNCTICFHGKLNAQYFHYFLDIFRWKIKFREWEWAHKNAPTYITGRKLGLKIFSLNES